VSRDDGGTGVIRQRQVAIMAYGSLIAEPGPELRPLIVERVPRRTPFPVEFGRASRRWGGGPVLVPHPAGGPVDGVLLVLSPAVTLGQATEALREREGLPTADGVVQVEADDGLLVLAASLPRNLPRPDLRPEALARRAAVSVSAGPRNGVAYLRAVMACGVRTPRTDAYARAVLSLADAGSLEDAEGRLVALAADNAGRGVDGLG
jgi:cation transport regulator ChaC